MKTYKHYVKPEFIGVSLLGIQVYQYMYFIIKKNKDKCSLIGLHVLYCFYMYQIHHNFV